MRVHPDIQYDVSGTALFLEKVVDMWKVLNVSTTGKDIRHNNPLEAVVRSADDPRLTFLLEMGDMFLQMSPPGGKRVKSLRKDTAKGLHHTLNGIVELCRQQLHTTHDYVTMNDYCSDPLEKEFGKMREGMGGT